MAAATIIITIIVATVFVVAVVDVVVAVKLEAKLRSMRDYLLNLRRDYDKLLDERTEYQVTDEIVPIRAYRPTHNGLLSCCNHCQNVENFLLCWSEKINKDISKAHTKQ